MDFDELMREMDGDEEAARIFGSRLYILEPDGTIRNEPNTLKFGYWFGTADRTIAFDKVGAYEVSTVFLGIDHNHSGKGGPVLFETMTFGFPDGLGRRYRTKEEALKGHAEILAEVLKAVASN